MEFVLKENHRNVPDLDLLNDLKRVANKLNKKNISMKEYNENGGIYHSGTIKRRFGWNNALIKAGLEVTGKKATRSAVIFDIQNVAHDLGQDTLTSVQYDKYGKYGRKYVEKMFGSWANALKEAKLKPTGFKKNYTKQECFDEIERVWLEKGSQPTTTDIEKGIMKISKKVFQRLFGSFTNALKEFDEYINSDEKEEYREHIEKEHVVKDIGKQIKHKTSRHVSKGLREDVLRRDDYKCCICGRHQGDKPGLKLVIDHIYPYSKGGETIYENLQTLCSECNAKKSDKEIDI